jgi:hypothetical protein
VIRVVPLILIWTSCALPSLTPVTPSNDCITGQISLVGTDFQPATVVRDTEEGTLTVTGEQEHSIRELSGAVLTLCGTISPPNNSLLGSAMARANRTIEAQSLELRSVDGMTAYLGILQKDGDNWKLLSNAESSPIQIQAIPQRLTEAIGSRVWVAGEWNGTYFRVQSFGLLQNL